MTQIRWVQLALLIAVATCQDDDREAQAQKALADSLTDAMAMLEHGSEAAKEQAAGMIASLAVETTISQPYHPLTFRNACVRAGVVNQLSKLLGTADSSVRAQGLTLAALEAIATDDPTTDVDNGHALVVCQSSWLGGRRWDGGFWVDLHLGHFVVNVRLRVNDNPVVQRIVVGCLRASFTFLSARALLHGRHKIQKRRRRS